MVKNSLKEELGSAQDLVNSLCKDLNYFNKKTKKLNIKGNFKQRLDKSFNDIYLLEETISEIGLLYKFNNVDAFIKIIKDYEDSKKSTYFFLDGLKEEFSTLARNNKLDLNTAKKFNKLVNKFIENKIGIYYNIEWE